MNHISIQLYYHRVGEPQSQDTLILKDPENPTYMWRAGVTDELRITFPII
jgi:prolyl oligopeptidase